MTEHVSREGSRRARKIERLRLEIAEGRYETPGKLSQALDAFLDQQAGPCGGKPRDGKQGDRERGHRKRGDGEGVAPISEIPPDRRKPK